MPNFAHQSICISCVAACRIALIHVSTSSPTLEPSYFKALYNCKQEQRSKPQGCEHGEDTRIYYLQLQLLLEIATVVLFDFLKMVKLFHNLHIDHNNFSFT